MEQEVGVRKTNRKLFFKISLQPQIPKPVKKTIITYNMAHRIYKLYELSHNDMKITEQSESNVKCLRAKRDKGYSHKKDKNI